MAKVTIATVNTVRVERVSSKDGSMTYLVCSKNKQVDCGKDLALAMKTARATSVA